jgi:two-component system response regulator FixJ
MMVAHSSSLSSAAPPSHRLVGNGGLRREPMTQGILPTIFIVDDDEAVRGALRMLVTSFGWNARAYASGQEFLDALPQAAPDCVLLDLNMPGMTGADVQEVLHARGLQVPVILITGHGDPQLISRARAAGAGELLSKPFHEDELKHCIERALGIP